MAAQDYIVDKLDETLIIKLAEPYEKVEQVVGYVDEVIGEDSANKFERYFRWCQDNVNFSDWILLTDLNLANQVIDPLKPFWIEYKYVVVELETGHTMEFVSIALEIVSDNGVVRQVKQVGVDCCEPGQIPNGCQNLIVTDCCDPDDLFNPYGMLNNTLNMFSQLTNVVNDIFGHCVKYYKVSSDPRSKDVILNEYSLYDVIALKEIKILVPDNAFPPNEFQFSEFGMDFESFEIHITREEFQKAFGPRTMPQERDYIYFPLIDRMYEINSVALADPVVYKEIYYKATLRKWQERANVETPVDIQQDLDDLTLSVDELFGEEVKDETLKITKPQQYRTIGTGANDYVRSDLSKQLSISDYKINNNWVIVSKNHYELNKLTPNELAVKYRQRAKFLSTEDRAFTFWFQPAFPAERAYSILSSISESDGSDGNAMLTFFDERKYSIGDLIQITDGGDYNGFHRILQAPSGGTQFVIDTPFTGNVPGAKARSVVKTFLIHGYGGLFSGLSVEVTRTFIIVSINNVDYFFTHGVTFDPDKWYPLVLNLSNAFKSLSVYLYELDKQLNFTMPQNETSALKLLYNDLIFLPSQVGIDSEDYWALLAGPVKLTNIRIFKRIIEEEAHNIVLNQYVVHDTQYAELVDNAIPELQLLRLPNPR
jgi:hypothetical protein